MIELAVLLTVHFVGDFILQTNWQATNKSKNWNALTRHVGTYSLCFLPWGLKFVVLTFILHFITDLVTSHFTSKLWFLDMLSKPDDMPDGRFVGRFNSNRHNFFVMIGFDQLIHVWSLVWTWKLLFS